ncbi:MAG: hypothetical protein Q8Q33_05355 [Chlamydiota bacterium]|nr:hypothetical protein [Chlamydiota bacterium]
MNGCIHLIIVFLGLVSLSFQGCSGGDIGGGTLHYKEITMRLPKGWQEINQGVFSAGPSSNGTIMSYDMRGKTIQQLVNDTIGKEGAKVSKKAFKIDGLDAIELIIDSGYGGTTLELYIANDKKIIIVSMTTPNERFQKERTIFQEIYKTIKINRDGK